MKIIGEEYLVKAFQFAHEADPAAELYYNDYSLENQVKRKGALALVRKLQAAGAQVTGIGSQTHIHMTSPTIEEEDATLAELGSLGIKVMITELDVNMLPQVGPSGGADLNLRVAENPALNPYRDGLPDEKQQLLAQRYADLFAVFVKHSDTLKRVTFWGVTDGDSWLNDWPMKGRTNYPLLFDRAGNPKPAFARVLDAAGRR
jgi:endo-1,4-beta-xylanase